VIARSNRDDGAARRRLEAARRAGGGRVEEQEREARRRTRELFPRLKEHLLRTYAFHEAGHLIVAAYLGVVPEEIGVEVASRWRIGVVMSRHLERSPRQTQATVLAAGGAAEERLADDRAPARGVESDEEMIAALGLSAAAEGRARRRARELVARLWPFIEALAGVLMETETHHMSGETAVFVALARVFGPEDAVRRSEMVPLARAFETGAR
jgi:hypothetical protein